MSFGGCSTRSRTSVTTSGDNEATMKSNFVLWAAILLVAKVASTWANHTEGSAGQKGGSLRLMLVAATTGVSPVGSCAGECSLLLSSAMANSGRGG